MRKSESIFQANLQQKIGSFMKSGFSSASQKRLLTLF